MCRPIILVAAAVGLLPGLVACQRPQIPAATAAPAATPAAAPAAAQPKLWSIEVMDGEKAVSRVDICADAALQKAFVRPSPEIGGKPCARVGKAVEKLDTYSVRCRTDDQLYRVGSVTGGDLSRDFTVDMAVTRQDRKGPTFEQVRRYRLVGVCPTGWNIGDSAAPGDKQLLDTLSGRTRPLPSRAG